jgi:hypothetical protein
VKLEHQGGWSRTAWVAAVACSLAAPAATAANTYSPTRFDDPPPNRCRSSDCSLREALRAAENHGGRDQVVLRKGAYELEIPDTQGLGIEVGDLNVNGPLTVSGKGARKTTIDGNGLDRVFAVGGKRVLFERFRIKGGDSGANPGHTGVGGGITAIGENLRLRNLFITKNEATFGGGVLSTAAKLSIKNTTFRLNRATEGAGLDLQPAFAEVPVTAIRSTTFDTNLATLKGAGVLVDGASATGGGATMKPDVEFLNSTVAGNVAVGAAGPAGGGIMADNGATVPLDNATVAGNRAGDVVNDGIGGGIYQHSGAVFNVGDSVIAANFVGFNGMATANAAGAQCAGSFGGLGGVLIQFQPGTACSIPGATGTNNAGLGAFGDNGGPTATWALEAGSPAIGLAESCPPKDQRGVARPPSDCDSGAFESDLP